MARYAGSTSAQDQPRLPRAASPSQSAWAPRIHIIPLTAADPPSTRPRSHTSSAPPGVTGLVLVREEEAPAPEGVVEALRYAQQRVDRPPAVLDQQHARSRPGR